MRSDLELMGDVLARNRAERRRPIPLVIFDKTMRSTDMHQVGSGIGPIYVFFSEETALQACAGVYWHDDERHCRTWTDGGGCACDVEGVDCTPTRPPPMGLSTKPLPPELLQQLGLVPAPPDNVFVLDLRIGPNGVELKGAPRLPTPAEAVKLQQTPPLPGGPPVVLAAEARNPVTGKLCECPACKSRAAAEVFGGPGLPSVGKA